jgi:hypothetical protein
MTMIYVKIFLQIDYLCVQLIDQLFTSLFVYCDSGTRRVQTGRKTGLYSERKNDFGAEFFSGQFPAKIPGDGILFWGWPVFSSLTI